MPPHSISGSPHSSSTSSAIRRWLITSTITTLAWIPCETLGGLIFLAAGIRLWAYYVTPIFWALTSPVAWGFVFLVAGGNCSAYKWWEQSRRLNGPRRWLFRAAFLAVAGPVMEVIWNSAIWWTAGTPLYLYTVLPTFEGSGSLLSPFYYQTLLSGFWAEDTLERWLTWRKPASEVPYADSPTDRAASRSK